MEKYDPLENASFRFPRTIDEKLASQLPWDATPTEADLEAINTNAFGDSVTSRELVERAIERAPITKMRMPGLTVEGRQEIELDFPE